MYHDILLPVDGSGGASRAAHRALALAASHDARVHALHVVDIDRYGEPARSSTELLVDDLEDAGSEALEQLRVVAADHGVELTTRCCHGHPPEEILAHAAAVDADLVVMGVSGCGGRRTGRVASAIARDCENDVLAV